VSVSTTKEQRAGAWLEAQDAAHQRGLVRGIALSFALHLLVGFAIAYAPKPDPIYLPEVISVRMVAMPAASAPTKSAPKVAPAKPAAPEPVPAKPLPAPVPKKVILPKQAVVVKKKAKPKLDPLDYDDALDAIREELGDEEPLLKAPPRVETVEGVEDRAPTEAEGALGQIDPDEAAWKLAVDRHMSNVYVVPQDFKGQGLRTALRVRLSAAGDVLGTPEVLRSSGNPYFDDTVKRALVRATPLPAPPEPGDFRLNFNADE
jgi:colicin import membrane protein